MSAFMCPDCTNTVPHTHKPGLAEAFRETVNHPEHYGGVDNPYEVIKVIDAWDLGFNLGNAVKYIARAGKKDAQKEVEDLKKAAKYLEFQIKKREAKLIGDTLKVIVESK